MVGFSLYAIGRLHLERSSLRKNCHVRAKVMLNEIETTDELVSPWQAVPTDTPIPLLSRQKIEGDNMLFAMVNLTKGCLVPVHSHISEQFAYVISGKVRWTLGKEGRNVTVTGGNVVRLPSNFPHGVEALEDTVILDVLAPVGAMGVDSHTTG